MKAGKSIIKSIGLAIVILLISAVPLFIAPIRSIWDEIDREKGKVEQVEEDDSIK